MKHIYSTNRFWMVTNQCYKEWELELQGKHSFLTVLIKLSCFSCSGLQGQQYLFSFASSLSMFCAHHGKKKKGGGVNWPPDYLYVVSQNHGPTVLYKHCGLSLDLEGFASKMKRQEKNRKLLLLPFYIQGSPWEKQMQQLIPRLQRKIRLKGWNQTKISWLPAPLSSFPEPCFLHINTVTILL